MQVKSTNKLVSVIAFGQVSSLIASLKILKMLALSFQLFCNLHVKAEQWSSPLKYQSNNDVNLLDPVTVYPFNQFEMYAFTTCVLVTYSDKFTIRRTSWCYPWYGECICTLQCLTMKRNIMTLNSNLISFLHFKRPHIHYTKCHTTRIRHTWRLLYVTTRWTMKLNF